MPKRKPPRRQRRGRSRPLPAPPPRPAPAAPAPVTQPVAPQAATPSPAAGAPARERSLSRFTARDYTYVRRELLRIVVLAVLIFATLVVLSFFLP